MQENSYPDGQVPEGMVVVFVCGKDDAVSLLDIQLQFVGEHTSADVSHAVSHFMDFKLLTVGLRMSCILVGIYSVFAEDVSKWACVHCTHAVA